MRMIKSLGLSSLVAGAALVGWIGWARPVPAADEKQVDFTRDIQPIFKQSCVRCHSLDNPRKQAAGGLRLDNEEDAMKGGKTGKDIEPGNSKDSLLFKLLNGPVEVNGHKLDPMPKAMMRRPFKALPKNQIDLIGKWIDQGAKWGK